MTRFLNKLFGKTHPAPATRARLGVESLDRRDMPSATANLVTATGVLTITGTAAADSISVFEVPNAPLYTIGGASVTVDGKAAGFISAANVRSVVANLGGGGDTFTVTRNLFWQLGTPLINPYLGVLQSIRVDAGDGDDTVNLAGALFAPSTVLGGSGDDKLHGTLGADTLVGGPGRDSLTGDDGNDTIFGADQGDYGYTDNFNTILGNGGNDRLYGGNGGNWIFGGAGNDSLYGGKLSLPGVTPPPPGDAIYGSLLSGDAGADRLLLRDTSGLTVANPATVINPDPADARVHFQGQYLGNFLARDWSDREIEWADDGFGRLVDRTGNTVLLKHILGGEQTLQRLATLPGTAPGTVTLGDNTGTLIRITDAAAASADKLGRTVVHELGHNWGNRDNLNYVTGSFGWSDWLAQSGWQVWDSTKGPMPANTTQATDLSGAKLWIDAAKTQAWVFKSGAAFARTDGYGRTNPFEDWSTNWEAAFYTAPDLVKVAGKQAQLSIFFTDISNIGASG